MFCGSVCRFGTNIQKIFQWKNVRWQEELQSCSFWYCIEKQGGKNQSRKRALCQSCSVQNKIFIMLGHLADQNQVWLDNFTFYSDTILLLKISAIYYTACSHNAFIVLFCLFFFHMQGTSPQDDCSYLNKFKVCIVKM